ncbi:MAG: hypothetical protein CVU44_21725 [Chloroflexi bacterium HGW-Chloroflexi-6]|nr:MAG: hypothetical protein CVU44_21725 [Chloroflexi bacterium HGW-Chloroflexi-6]
MTKTIALLTLLLASLACSLPFANSTPDAAEPTLDLSTLVAENLTAAAAEAPTAAPVAADTPTPEPAPTNLHIVYARSGNLVLWRESDAPLSLTSSGLDEAPIISDDGQVIAFLRNGELHSVRADGSGERLLISQAYMDSFRAADVLSVRLLEFDFAPASHEVYFSLLGETEAFPMHLNDLQRVNADSGAINIVLPAGSGGGDWTFSPDRQWLALAQSNQIRVMRPDGTQDRVIFKFKMVSTYSEWFYFPQVVWRNDSVGLYTVIPASAILENPSEPTRYFYIPLTGEAAKLAEFAAAPVWQSFPFISPDGIKVAYVRESGGTQSLHVIDASTADRVYTSAPALAIRGWNPDSERVIYHADDPLIVNILAFGAAPVRISESGSFSGLQWVSPEKYLFLNGEELRLRLLPAASTIIENGVSGYDFALVP